MFVAIAQRGLFIGNRGIIHDPATKTLLGRRCTTKAWLVCLLDYEGRHREVMGGPLAVSQAARTDEGVDGGGPEKPQLPLKPRHPELAPENETVG
jgi:hypothetical protein